MLNVLVYSHQLFEKNRLIKKDSHVYIVEHPHFFTKYKFNINKLIYHRSTTKFYYNYVKKILKPEKIYYINFNEYDNKKEKLYSLEIEIYDPIENELVEELKKYKKIKMHESPMFMTPIKYLKEYNSSTNLYLMNNFYIWQRKRLNLFMTENGKPYYDKWSFDKDNRKKFPNDFTETIQTFKNKYVLDACKYFNVNIESLHCWLPITFLEVKAFFKNFIKNKIEKFGNYEDAISHNILIGNHSLLSSILNIGMITPYEIIKKIKKLENNKNFKKMYNSIEGFTRQIIGWREYMRYVYIFEYDNLVTNNLKHKKK